MSRAILGTATLALTVGGFGACRDAEPALAPNTPVETAAVDAGEIEHAILAVLRDPDGHARVARLSALLRDLDASSVPAVRATLRTAEGDRGAAEIELLVRAWAKHEPEAATRWAFVTAPKGYKIAAIIPAMESWASAEPESALRFVRGMTAGGGPNKEAAEVALVRGWFASGKPGLEDYIWDLGMGYEQQRALRVFAREWIQRARPEPVAHWAEALPDERERYKLAAFRQVGTELAKAHPEAAVAWCDAHCAGPFGDAVRKLIATHWAKRDPRAVLEWLRVAPEGASRDRSLRAAYRSWLSRNRPAAQRFVADMGLEGLEPWLRPLAGMYASSISREEPARALEWAALIEGDYLREQAFVTFARRWYRQDQTAAETWLADSPLSEEAREEVRKRRRTPRRGRIEPTEESAPDPSGADDPSA